MRRCRVWLFTLTLVLIAGLWPAMAKSPAVQEGPQPAFVPNELLIRFKPDIPQEQIEAFYQEHKLRPKEPLMPGEPEQAGPLVLTQSSKDIDQSLLETIQRDARISYAELNYILQVVKVPDDPEFQKLWGLHNTGQTGGKVDADIDAPEAWEINTGSSQVIVA
ncbi:MAG: hypothetical protein RML36_17235, partial [Anaerolineae bacterium]|nr:hypothetical protein [Anaerolineae bacterium]